VGFIWLLPDLETSLLILWGGALFLVAAGFIDDISHVSVPLKYGTQLIAAIAIAVYLEPTLHVNLPFAAFTMTGLVAIVASTIWITATTNAFNFVDGIDGISAGGGLLTALALALMIGAEAQVVMLPLAAALAGFLVWNLNPALIFMGDAGSQFLGFCLGAAVLLSSTRDVDVVPVLLVFSPFLFDTGFTIVRRHRAGFSIFIAHRAFLYQRLNNIGLTHRSSANIFYGLICLGILAGLGYRHAGDWSRLVLMVTAPLVLTTLLLIIMRFERVQGIGPDLTVLPTRQLH
jgi:UDP-N-acetylmuramyl pentapeptide phosphotransferase/UDP-N-acetylglucosamine-1-phosphate transferase